LRALQRIPAVDPDPRDDPEILAQGLDHRGFAFGEIGRTGDAVERIAVTHDDQVGTGAHRSGEDLPQLRVAV
jgi:hypothetical protein